MSEERRDEVVARALRELPVPEHRPTFWADLDRALDAEAARPAGIDDVPPAPGAMPINRPATGELPVVTRLAPEEGRRSRRAPILAAAAAVVVLAVSVGLVVLAGTGDDGADLADAPSEGTDGAPSPENSTAAVPVPSGGQGPLSSVVPPELALDPLPPELVVQAWLNGIASGEIEPSVELTGPRSRAYIESLGEDATLERFLLESQEGYGGWIGTPDLEISSLLVGRSEPLGGELAIVTLSGRNAGEGGDGEPRVEVIPVVNDGDGWQVEFLALDPSRRDSRIELTVPVPGEAGLGVMNPTDEINVFVPSDGMVYFQIDGGELGSDTTSIVAGSPFALYNPPGDLDAGPHQLVVVAVGNDGTIASLGGTFLVGS